MINKDEASKLQEVKKLVDDSIGGLNLSKIKLWGEPVNKNIILDMAVNLESLNGASIKLKNLIESCKQEK